MVFVVRRRIKPWFLFLFIFSFLMIFCSDDAQASGDEAVQPERFDITLCLSGDLPEADRQAVYMSQNIEILCLGEPNKPIVNETSGQRSTGRWEDWRQRVAEAQAAVDEATASGAASVEEGSAATAVNTTVEVYRLQAELAENKFNSCREAMGRFEEILSQLIPAETAVEQGMSEDCRRVLRDRLYPSRRSQGTAALQQFQEEYSAAQAAYASASGDSVAGEGDTSRAGPNNGGDKGLGLALVGAGAIGILALSGGGGDDDSHTEEDDGGGEEEEEEVADCQMNPELCAWPGEAVEEGDDGTEEVVEEEDPWGRGLAASSGDSDEKVAFFIQNDMSSALVETCSQWVKSGDTQRAQDLIDQLNRTGDTKDTILASDLQSQCL